MKLINALIRVVLVILFIIGIYMLLIKITGHSPTLDQITLTLLAIIGGTIIKLMADFYRFEGKVEAHMETTKNTFMKIGNKLDSLESSVNKLKSDMRLVKHKLKIYN